MDTNGTTGNSFPPTSNRPVLRKWSRAVVLLEPSPRLAEMLRAEGFVVRVRCG